MCQKLGADKPLKWRVFVSLCTAALRKIPRRRGKVTTSPSYVAAGFSSLNFSIR
jgi:hypothetical protein